MATMEELTTYYNAKGFYFYNGHTFRYYPSSGGINGLSCDEAGIACINKGGHLATIENAEKNEFLNSLLSKYLSEDIVGIHVWLGALYVSEFNSWQWFSGEKFDYTNWLAEADSEYNENRPYVCLQAPEGKMSTAPRTAIYDYVCEWDYDIRGNVSDYKSYNGHIFKYFDTELTYINAEMACQDMGGYLADSTDAEKSEFLASLTTKTAWLNGTGTYDSEEEQGFICEWDNEMKVSEPTVTEPQDSEYKYLNGHTYKYISNALDWYEAKKDCEARNGHLATITSAEENALISTLTTSPAWLGGIDKSGHADYTWITDEEWNYTNWDVGVPAVHMFYNWWGENYLVINGDEADYLGKWYGSWVNNIGFTLTTERRTFDNKFGYICEWDYDLREPDYEQQEGEYRYFGGHTYKYFSNTLTWDKAVEACKALGGHLVTITSAEENDFLCRVYPDRNKDGTWLGGQSGSKRYPWITPHWATGEIWSYDNIDKEDPVHEHTLTSDGGCLLLTEKGTWQYTDMGNLISRAYICEWDYDMRKTKAIEPHYNYYYHYGGHSFMLIDRGEDNFTNWISWDIAERLCEAYGGHLATSTSAEKNAFLASLIPDGDDTAWIGGKYKDGWTWAKSDEMPDEAWDYINWLDSENVRTSDLINKDQNTLLQSDGKWIPTHTKDKYGSGVARYFICEWDLTLIRPGTTTSTITSSSTDGMNNAMFNYTTTGKPNYTYATNSGEPLDESYKFFGGHTFRHFDKAMSWEGAKKFCEMMSGHLATVSSAEENAFLGSLATSSPAWLGGTCEREGTWHWVTDEAWDYTNWNAGEPDPSTELAYYSDKISCNQLWTVLLDSSSSNKWASQYAVPNRVQLFTSFICEWDYDIRTTGKDPLKELQSEILSKNCKYYGGHTFSYLDTEFAGYDANLVCELLGGHLATAPSADKNTFLTTVTTSSAWLGGIDKSHASGELKSWEWITGETWDYTNWTEGYPESKNIILDDEYLKINDSGEGHLGEWNNAGTYMYHNDYVNANGVYYVFLLNDEAHGFICEWDEVIGTQTEEPTPTVEPEPTVEPTPSVEPTPTEEPKDKGFKFYNGHSFKYFTTALTWSEARDVCEALGGHLATSTSEEKNTFLTTVTTERAWLGGTDKETEGTWQWITGEEWNYTSWASGEPDNANGGENYLEINFDGTGKWNDLLLKENLGFICEWDCDFKSMSTAAFMEWLKAHEYKKNDGHTFKFLDAPITWAKAKSICEELDAHLATSTSEEKNTFVSSLTQGPAWLGATDEKEEGKWEWVTGETWNYTNWHEGEPNNSNNNTEGVEHYMEMYAGGDWNDRPASYTLGFICEWDKIAEEPIVEPAPIVIHEALPDLLGGAELEHYHLTKQEWEQVRARLAVLYPDGGEINPPSPTFPTGSLPAASPPEWTAHDFPMYNSSTQYSAYAGVHKMYYGTTNVDYKSTPTTGLNVLMEFGSSTSVYVVYTEDLLTWTKKKLLSKSTFFKSATSGICQYMFLESSSSNSQKHRLYTMMPEYNYAGHIRYFYGKNGGYYTDDAKVGAKTAWVACCYSPSRDMAIFASSGGNIARFKGKAVLNKESYNCNMNVNLAGAAWLPTAGGLFCLTGNKGSATSSDGASWTLHLNAPKDLVDLVYREDIPDTVIEGSKGLVAFSKGEKIFYASNNGKDWVRMHDTPVPLSAIAAIAYCPDNGWYCAIGGNSKFAYFSKNLKDWVDTQVTNENIDMGSVIWMPSVKKFVLMPKRGTTYYTFSPSEWTNA